MPEPLLYDSHMHTPLCKHAEGEPEEYAAVAEQRGLRGVIFTCHNPMPESYGHAGRMEIDEIEQYKAMIERARVAWEGRIDVRMGIEADFFPGYERWVERQLREHPFEYVLGSVHHHLPIYRRRYRQGGDAVAFQKQYFSSLAEAAEAGLFDALSHPDLVKNTDPGQWDPARIMPCIQRCLDRIAATGIAMELNTSGLLKRLPEFNPGPLILERMREREIPVVLGSDSHTPTRVAESFQSALDLLQSIGYTHVSFFLNRRRREVEISRARETLRETRPVDVL